VFEILALKLRIILSVKSVGKSHFRTFVQ